MVGLSRVLAFLDLWVIACRRRNSSMKSGMGWNVVSPSPCLSWVFAHSE